MAVIPKLHTRYSGANENTDLIQRATEKQEVDNGYTTERRLLDMSLQSTARANLKDDGAGYDTLHGNAYEAL